MRPTQAPTSRSFRLVRHFSLVSLVAVAGVASLLAWFYGWHAEQALIEQGQQKNFAQLQLLLNQWPARERELVSSLLAMRSTPASDAGEVRELAAHFQSAVAGTSIRKLKLYTGAGLTVFSSESKQIGELKADYPGFVAASKGTPYSQLSFRDRFEAFGGAIRDVYLIGSYLPVRNDSGGIDGVVEIYDDVTSLALAIRTTRWQVIGLTVLTMSILYLALLGVVRRASRIQRANHLLELEVAEHTRATREAQAALEVAESARHESEIARAAADDANRAKSVFLATMSHEIRTPLNGIIGMTEVLQAGTTSDKQQEQLQIVHSSALSLLRLLSDLLEYSRLESEAVQLHATRFSPAAMLAELVASSQPLARERGISLESCVGPAVPEQVLADEGRVRQVLGNLVGNALKFTHAGRVEVELDCDPASSGRLRFRVRDTGIGIDADHLERIFRPFEQVDGTITRRYGGAGLGLSICRRLVDLLGGQIGVQSSPGRGSTFWFTMCFDVAEPIGTSAMPAAPAVARPFSARVLVVEDNLVNQIVAREILRGLGCIVNLVASGEEALVTLGREQPDLILLDLHMNGIDGMETARRIRAREDDLGTRPTPIVALTADAFPQTREACLRSGMDEVITKPFTRKDIADLLARMLAARSVAVLS